MTRQKTFISAIASLFLLATPAQIFAQNWQDNLKEAKHLYINKMYQNAQTLFQKAARQISEEGGGNSSQLAQAEGYRLLCALKLQQPNAEKQASGYIKKYPSSTLVPKIRFEAASLFFSREEFGKAMKLVEELQPSEIEKDDRDRYLLLKGVCLMKDGRIIEAENHLEEISQHSLSYPDGRYYLGYLNYGQGEFAAAIPFFEEAAKSRNYELQSPVYIADCRFMLKDYRYVVDNAPAIYNRTEGTDKARLARIISESWYALGNSSEAELYFQNYARQKELTKTDSFYSGMLSYSQGNWREASSLFQKCVSFADTDSLTQNALYRIGRCKIEEKDKVTAAEAFKKASEMDFNPEIKEDAFFNYAKLSFDLWANAENLYQYLRNYNPNAKKKNQTYGYIAARCLEDKDYAGAVEALEKISNPSEKDLANLQKANFFLGTALLEQGRYYPAQSFLEKAAGGKQNQQISNLAAFWLAESLFRQEKFLDALDILDELQSNTLFQKTAEYATSFFNSGYDRLRLKDIDGACRDFEKYAELAGIKGDYYAEARMRIADCKFMQRDFKAASAIYSQLSKATAAYTLYAPVQEALAQGLSGNNKKKVEILKQYTSDIYKKSELYTQALFELGRTQVLMSDIKEAENTFLKLTRNPVDSIYYGKSLIELGMLYANSSNNAKAKECYRRATAWNPETEEAQAAMNAYQNLCNQEGNPDEFMKWVTEIAASGKQVGGAKDNTELLFNSAEQVFLAQKYEAAAEGFRNFIAEYPDYKPEKTWYYLAESLSRLSNYSSAAEAYSTLVSISGSTDMKKKYARQEMDMLFSAKEYNKLILKTSSYAEKFNWEPEQARQLDYYAGKSLLAEGERDAGMEKIKAVAENTSDIIGAEAAYLIVKDAFDSGKMEKVEGLVFELSEQNIDRYYLAKCYLLLGDSYLENEDFEQAEAVYQSIFKSYQGDAQIKETAKAKMEEAKRRKEEAKR